MPQDFKDKRLTYILGIAAAGIGIFASGVVAPVAKDWILKEPDTTAIRRDIAELDRRHKEALSELRNLSSEALSAVKAYSQVTAEKFNSINQRFDAVNRLVLRNKGDIQDNENRIERYIYGGDRAYYFLPPAPSSGQPSTLWVELHRPLDKSAWHLTLMSRPIGVPWYARFYRVGPRFYASRAPARGARVCNRRGQSDPVGDGPEPATCFVLVDSQARPSPTGLDPLDR